MQAPQQNPEVPLVSSFLPGIIQWLLQALGYAAMLLVITQNIDFDFSAKEVRSRVHYKGNVLLDLKRQTEK